MFSGSGTNIKMFDFMAAGLPVVTTPVGARGIMTSRKSFIVCSGETMASAIKSLAKDDALRLELGANARLDAERNYSWEQISSSLGVLLRRSYFAKREKRPAPFFSVIIPTFERPDSLTRVLDLLSIQSERDFEVIVVDQSENPWPGQNLNFNLDLLYVRSAVCGAVRARNFGAMLARGRIIAFLDDDCEPSMRWLEAAKPLFASPHVVGVEGLVESSRLDDPNWRPVTNRSFAGLGFMTANLFVRRAAFYQVSGFDISFEDPHFREDTDFGWRVQELGQMPFSEEAWVYHPPHSREKARESQAARDRFFEKDVLLLQKHPARYRELFVAEGHWRNTDGFWVNFLRGSKLYGVSIPEELLQYAPKA
jgi:glycosyltransferase involved in cell wall biosynthesis